MTRSAPGLRLVRPVRPEPDSFRAVVQQIRDAWLELRLATDATFNRETTRESSETGRHPAHYGLGGSETQLRSTFAVLAREGPTQLRAVVLAGDGPSFCAGADLRWMRAAMALDTEGNEQDAMAMADMFEVIDTCPAPVVARVHGAALGGGMGLCAVADLVVAESRTRFGFTETRLGILPSVISPFVIAKIGEIGRAHV